MCIRDSVNTGLTAYQKKPEFGGATIFVDSIIAEEVKYLVLNDDVSSIYVQ